MSPSEGRADAGQRSPQEEGLFTEDGQTIHAARLATANQGE